MEFAISVTEASKSFRGVTVYSLVPFLYGQSIFEDSLQEADCARRLYNIPYKQPI